MVHLQALSYLGRYIPNGGFGDEYEGTIIIVDRGNNEATLMGLVSSRVTRKMHEELHQALREKGFKAYWRERIKTGWKRVEL